MNNEEKNGWKMVWAGVGLMVASCLLTWFVLSAESFGLHGVPYCVVIGILCIAYVVAFYIVVRRFFGKKKVGESTQNCLIDIGRKRWY